MLPLALLANGSDSRRTRNVQPSTLSFQKGRTDGGCFLSRSGPLWSNALKVAFCKRRYVFSRQYRSTKRWHSAQSELQRTVRCVFGGANDVAEAVPTPPWHPSLRFISRAGGLCATQQLGGLRPPAACIANPGPVRVLIKRKRRAGGVPAGRHLAALTLLGGIATTGDDEPRLAPSEF